MAYLWQRFESDGGMTQNDWLMQFLADIINLPVDPVVRETTALGAAMLALMQTMRR